MHPVNLQVQPPMMEKMNDGKQPIFNRQRTKPKNLTATLFVSSLLAACNIMGQACTCCSMTFSDDFSRFGLNIVENSRSGRAYEDESAPNSILART